MHFAAFPFGDTYWLSALPAEPFVEKELKSYEL